MAKNKDKKQEEAQVETAAEEVKDKETDKLEELEKNIETLSGQLAAEKDAHLRLRAEFENYRRRTSQEKLDLISSASAETIKGLLPILDDFERALKALQDSEDSASAKEGTELIYNKLMSYLKSCGVSVIQTVDAQFNTDYHEAVAQFPVQDEALKGKIFDTVQTGYMLGEKVIRYAKVVVGI